MLLAARILPLEMTRFGLKVNPKAAVVESKMSAATAATTALARRMTCENIHYPDLFRPPRTMTRRGLRSRFRAIIMADERPWSQIRIGAVMAPNT